MKKRIISVILSVAAGVYLCGCAGGTSVPASSAAASAAPESAAASSAAPASVQSTAETESSSAEASNSELTEISIGTTAWPTNMLFYLADKEGIFAKNGIKVNIQQFSSTTDSTNAFIGGQTDFCTFASSETISPYAQGADFKIVLETDKSNGCEGLVAKSDIKTIKDFKGKTIATQLYSVDHMFLLTLLDQNGMTADDVKIVDMSIQESGSAFIAGQCDAACIWDPYFSQAVAAGGTKLYSSADNPDLITDVVGASKDICDKHPDAVKALVKSYFEAVDYYNSNKDEASAYMGEKLGVDADEFNKETEGLLFSNQQEVIKAFTPADDYSYWGYTQNKVLEFMKGLGVIDADVDCGGMIDSSFVESLSK